MEEEGEMIVTASKKKGSLEINFAELEKNAEKQEVFIYLTDFCLDWVFWILE
jgi:hypothetical protein